MAYGFRLDDVRMAYIRISRPDIPPGHLAFALVLDKVAYPLTRAVLQKDTLSINDELCEVERILQRAGNRQVSVLIRDTSGARPDHVEPVLFHHSFFLPFVDYVRAMPLSPDHRPPELLAAFTHAHDDNEMLRFWEQHHAKLVDHRHLYVIDHGSAVSPRTVLHAHTNVVSLPRGSTDHGNMARYCGHFQRFLLSQYRWVLHTDADELLVHEQGNEALLARLAGQNGQFGPTGEGPSGILKPAQAFEVLHDVRTEKRLRPGKPVSEQRSLLLPALELYRKPVLASVPASWLPGFHLVYEEMSVREEPGLLLMHLQSADAHLLLAKNRKWNALSQSETDFKRSPQNGRPGDKKALGKWFAQTLADERVVPIPEALRGKF